MNSIRLLVLLSFWLINTNIYADTLCTDTLSRADSGILTDSGGVENNYGHRENCSFLIEPSTSGPITLNLLSFASEFFFDRLQIYDGTDSSGRLLATLTGNRSPQRFTATSGAIFLRFSSDSSVSRPGFVASWSVVHPRHGILGLYYDQNAQPRQYFTGAVVPRVDPVIDFNWAHGSPVAGVGSQDFSVRWLGEIEIPTSGRYTFSTTSDDGVRLWINDQLIIDNWTDHSARTDSAVVSGLVAGRRYPVVMEYYERGGRAVARLQWQGPGVARQVIPEQHLFRELQPPRVDSALRSCLNPQIQLTLSEPVTRVSAENIANYRLDNNAQVTRASLDASGRQVTLDYSHPNTHLQQLNVSVSQLEDFSGNVMNTSQSIATSLGTNGLLASYYAQNGRPGQYFTGQPITQVDSVVDFDWGSGPPTAGVGSNFFSVRWEGEIEIPRDGNYRFSTVSDDGVRLWIDNRLVINNWTQHSARTDTSASLRLVGGRRYSIRMEYFEHGGRAVAKLLWQGPGISRQVIPNSQLFLDCPSAPALDHFVVGHDGSGIHCLAEPVSVTAMSSAGVYTGFNGAINLDTQTGRGRWSLLSGRGRLINQADTGQASYQFDPADQGVATFSLYYPEGNPTVDIDAVSGGIRDNDAEGVMTFNPSGFTVTATSLSNPPPAVINDPVPTQVAGQAFSLHVAAYGTLPADGQCGIIETYTGDQTLTIATDYIDPTTGTRAASGGGRVSFTQGQARVGVNYADVGRIRVSVSDTTGLSGATNPFVVQPADFAIRVAANPATQGSGSGFIAAGENFSATVEALTQTGALAPNYGRERQPESVSLSIAGVAFPSGGDPGQLSGGDRFALAAAGQFNNSSLSWSEVGSIRLRASVADGDYLDSGQVTGSESNIIGRFYPYQFALLSSSTGHECTSFSYFSEPSIHVNYLLEAQSTDGSRLQNYDAALGYPVSSIDYHAENDNNGIDLSSRVTAATGIWASGHYQVDIRNGSLARSSSLEAPMGGLELGLSVGDVADNRLLAGLNMAANAMGDCALNGSCTALKIGGPLQLLFGRLRLPDAFGPETATLVAELQTQYWNGARFVTNSQDSCTRLARTAISLDGIATSSQLSVDLGGGVTTSQYAALGVNDIGVVTGDVGLSFTPPGTAIGRNRFAVDIDLSAKPWLRFDWDQDGDFSNDLSLPAATMGFQSYRGHDRILYWRERFD